MKVSVVPILQNLRDIYNVDGGPMRRFRAYTDLMVEGPEMLPLGVFSPMGRAQPQYLDQLLQLKAETIAASAAKEAADVLARDSSVFGNNNKQQHDYRLMLVVADAPADKNTWTDRYITDAEWRIENKYNQIPQQQLPGTTTAQSWVTVQLWTDQDPIPSYIEQETKAALYRAVHRTHLGMPATLDEMMKQEGRAQAFAVAGEGRCSSSSLTRQFLQMDDDDLEYSRQILDPILQSAHYPTCFSALYGDDAARAAGYPTLGLSHLAGLQVALANALDHQSAESGYFVRVLN